MTTAANVTTSTQASTEQVPQHVLALVGRDVAGLIDFYKRLSHALRFGGPVSMSAMLDDCRPDVDLRLRTVATFRRLCAAKGIDAEAVLTAAGGVPDFGPIFAAADRANERSALVAL